MSSKRKQVQIIACILSVLAATAPAQQPRHCHADIVTGVDTYSACDVENLYLLVANPTTDTMMIQHATAVRVAIFDSTRSAFLKDWRTHQPASFLEARNVEIPPMTCIAYDVMVGHFTGASNVGLQAGAYRISMIVPIERKRGETFLIDTIMRLSKNLTVEELDPTDRKIVDSIKPGQFHGDPEAHCAHWNSFIKRYVNNRHVYRKLLWDELIASNVVEAPCKWEVATEFVRAFPQDPYILSEIGFYQHYYMQLTKEWINNPATIISKYAKYKIVRYEY